MRGEFGLGFRIWIRTKVKSGSIPQSRVSIVIATQRRQPRTPFWNSGLVQIRHPLAAAPVSTLKINNNFSA